jgi:hypothetical protein
LALALLVGGAAGVADAIAQASATLCVGSTAGCYATYAGGVTITKILKLVGVGAGSTTIRGDERAVEDRPDRQL